MQYISDYQNVLFYDSRTGSAENAACGAEYGRYRDKYVIVRTGACAFDGVLVREERALLVLLDSRFDLYYICKAAAVSVEVPSRRRGKPKEEM